MKIHHRHVITIAVIFLSLGIARAELTVGTVAHVKGQETNTLHGFGIVVGLKGTGDKTKDFLETARSLGRMMELFGHHGMSLKELASTKNVALVTVTVTVPGVGAREGDLLDCRVASIGSATSLEGGELMLTSLLGPVPAKSPEDAIVYAQASGILTLEKRDTPTVARITNGCKLEDDFFNPYVKDGIVTLVIDERYATWGIADDVALAVDRDSPNGTRKAMAINQNNVLVELPADEDPVRFIADFMKNEVIITYKVPTVVINSRTGGITIDEDVEITPTTVTHGNMTITIAAPAANGAQPPQPPTRPERFVGVDTESKRAGVENPKLKALNESLNAVNVPAKDIIEIIEMLNTQGNLHGRIIYK